MIPAPGPGSAIAQNFRHRLLAMLGLCFVIVMVALDQTVIGTALPTVVAELRGFQLYAWVGTAYLLTTIITVPIFGKLGDEHGRKRFVLIAIVLFTLASMMCGLAQSMQQLVWSRALQGIGGGMLVATAFASVPDMFPDARQRLRWQVLFSSAFGVANAVGPSLGGFLTEYLGWRWVFFVNLPAGLLSLWFIWRYLPRIRHGENAPARLDWLGALLIALTLGSLLLLVEWLSQGKPASTLIALAAAAALSGIALIWWERRCANPVLPLGMFSDRSLRPLLVLSLVLGFCMFSVMYYAPLLFQGGFGLSPKQAGLLITPLAVFITVGSIVNGRIVMRLTSPNSMLYVGLSCFCAAALLLTQTIIATPHALIYASMMLAGMGLGMLLPNLTLFAQASVQRTQLGVATAMMQSTRMIGGMLGMAVTGTLITQGYNRGVNDMLQAGNGERWRNWLGDPQVLVDSALADGFSAAVLRAGQDAAALLEGARLALVDAIHASHWLIAAVVALLLLVVRRLPAMNLDPAAPEAGHE